MVVSKDIGRSGSDYSNTGLNLPNVGKFISVRFSIRTLQNGGFSCFLDSDF